MAKLILSRQNSTYQKLSRLPTAFGGLIKLKLAQKDHITNIISDSFTLLSTQMLRTPSISHMS